MKHCYLLLALLLLAHFYVGSMTYLFLFIGFVIYMITTKKKISIMFLILLGLGLLITKSTIEISEPGKIVKIVMMKDQYAIASDGKQKVLLYQVDSFNYDDVLLLKGNYQIIDSVKNNPCFNFQEWANHQGIYYSMNVVDYKLLEKGNSLRHHLYEKVKQSKYSNILKYTIFQINQDEYEDLLVSSGVHFAMIIALIKKLLKQKIIIRNIIVWLLLSILMVLFGNMSVILRLFVNEGVKTIFSKYDRFDLLGIEMLLMMVLKPCCVYELAFIIVMFLRFFYLFESKVPKKILSILLIIVIQLYYFQEINIIQLVFFTFAKSIYTIVVVLSWILLFIDIEFIATIMNYLLSLLSFDRSAYTLTQSVSIIWIIIYLYHLIYLMEYGRFKDYLKVICLLVLVFVKPYLNPFSKVIMLDVGQGNCMVIVEPYQKEVIMIDVMGSISKNIPKEIIVPYLKSQGIHHIDKLIITHDDYDHAGGLSQLQELMNVDAIYRSYDDLQAFDKENYAFIELDVESDDINDHSIVSYFNYYGYYGLSMGDLSSIYEDQLVNTYPKLEVDYLVLSHHGSNTSTSNYLLHQYDPSIALISAGRNNRYQHPSQEVLQRLNKQQIAYLCTSENGSICLYFSKYFAFFMTSEQEFGIIKNK